MADNKPLTPEKQLLNIIEDPKQQMLRVEATKRQGISWFSFGALRGRLSFFKSFSFKKWSSFRQLSSTSVGIRQINLLLKFMIVFLAVYLGYTVFVMAVELKNASNLIFEYDKSLVPAPEVVSPLKSLAYYSEKVASRDLFNPATTSEAKEPEEKTIDVQPQENQIKKYSLVGIAWSDNPEAMIEDKEGKKTHFVRRGQMIDDDIKVIAIFKDAVILTKGDKEYELR